MKQNDEIVLIAFSNIYKIDDSLVNTCNTLYKFKLIDKSKYNKLLEIIKTSISIEDIFNVLIKNKRIVNYIIFFNNYHSLNQSVIMALDIYKNTNKVKKELVSALLYPSILIMMTSFALLFISNYIVPQLMLLNPKAINSYQFVILLLKYIPISILLVIAIVILFILILIILLNNDFNKYINRLIKFKITAYFLKLYVSIKFVIYLKEILKSIPLSLDSFKVLYEQCNDRFIKYLANDIISLLYQGISINDIFKDNNMILDDLKYYLLLSDSSSDMSNLMNEYYNIKRELIKQRIKVFLAVFIPIIISGIGLLLILMYLLIMMPILDMTSTI